MNCNNCGFELQNNAKFCDNCGTKVEGQSPASAPVQNTQPTYGQAPTPAPVQNTQPTYGQAPAQAPMQNAQPTYGQAPAPAPIQNTQPTYGQAPAQAPMQNAQPTYGQAPAQAPMQNTQPTYGQQPHAVQNQGNFNYVPQAPQYNSPPMGMNQNNYYAGTQTAVSPKKPNPLIFVAIGAFVVIVLSVLLFVFILPSLNTSDENSEYLGIWNATEYVMSGASISPEDMGTSMTLELKSGNNCTIVFNGEEYNGDWRYEDGVFALIDGSDEFTGTISGNNLSLTNILRLGFDVVFTKEGTSGSIEVTPPVAQSNATGSDSAAQDSTAQVPVQTGPLAVTQTLETGVYWYGTMTISNYSGSIERLEVRDVWGELMIENSTGLTFFQVFDTTDFDSATSIFSTYCTISDTQLFSTSYTDGDAWIFQKTLNNNEMVYFSPTLNEGVLEFNYYYNYNGESFDINIYLREDGKAWNENIDILPPSYDSYKQAIGGVSLSN